MKPDYALYKGDRFVDLGSKERLALVSGLSAETIERYSRPGRREKEGEGGDDPPWIVIKI